MRNDYFEWLYNSHWTIRMLLKFLLKVRQFVDGKVLDQMEDKISVSLENELRIYDGANQPYAGFEITIGNQNFSQLRVAGYDITISFGEGSGLGLPCFKQLSWCANCVSTPPKYAKIDDIEGHSDGKIRLDTMLPYYLYFPRRDDTTLDLSGTIIFETDVGRVEYEFEGYTHLLKKDLQTHSSCQDRLKESFEPNKMSI